MDSAGHLASWDATVETATWTVVGTITRLELVISQSTSEVQRLRVAIATTISRNVHL